MAVGVETDVRLDAADAGTDGLLTEEGDGADVRGVLHVRAAAQLHRERATDLDDADLVAVVLAEQGHRTHLLGLVEVGDEGVDGVVRRDGLVGDGLDVLLLLLGQGAGPREVEAQVAGLVERTGLHGVGAEHLAQRGVDQVGAGMTLGCALAPLGIDLHEDGVAFDDLTLEHRDLVRPQLLGDLLDVVDLDLQAGAGDGADVGDLAAGLRVEGAAVEDQLDLLAALAACRRSPPVMTASTCASVTSSLKPVNSVGPRSRSSL